MSDLENADDHVTDGSTDTVTDGSGGLAFIGYNYLAFLAGLCLLVTMLVMNWHLESLSAHHGEGAKRANRHLLIIAVIILLVSGSTVGWAIISAMRVVYPIG